MTGFFSFSIVFSKIIPDVAFFSTEITGAYHCAWLLSRYVSLFLFLSFLLFFLSYCDKIYIIQNLLYYSSVQFNDIS